MAMTSERPAMAHLPAPELEPRDRCRFGRDFDLETVECPAFQRASFIAATSYGKPLGAHVACSHLTVGELATNQFYPRCSLGTEVEKMHWVARMGPDRIEVLRHLTAEFEMSYANSLRELIGAKALALADPESRSGRAALTTVVHGFIADFTEFVNKHADRIVDLGISPSDLTDRAASALIAWQHSRRLDLPGLDDQSMLRPDGPQMPGNGHLDEPQELPQQ
jgi:hypothetical protein